MEEISRDLRCFSSGFFRLITGASAADIKDAKEYGLIPAAKGAQFNMVDAFKVTLMLRLQALNMTPKCIKQFVPVIINVHWKDGHDDLIPLASVDGVEVAFHPEAIKTIVKEAVDQIGARTAAVTEE